MADHGSVPPELRSVEAFLNTLDERSYSRHGTQHLGGDALTTPAALSAWLTDQGLAPAGAQAGQEDLAAALGLRAALRQALAQRSGHPAHAHAREEANTALARFTLRLALAPDGGPRLQPDAATSNAISNALGVIVAFVAQSTARGSWNRLRMCGAPDCRWIFYDNSRSGAGRWCSMAACGNRDKTRRYRERHHPTSRTGSPTPF